MTALSLPCDRQVEKAVPIRRRIALAVAGRHGIITSRELQALGATESWIQSQVELGYLYREARGVYSVGHQAITADARHRVVTDALGPGAAIDAWSAACRWDVSRRPAPTVHAVSPRYSRMSSIEASVRTCRTLRPSDVIVLRGVPTTTLPRALADLGRHWTTLQITHAIREAQFRYGIQLQEVAAVLARDQTVRGRGRVLKALGLRELGSAGTKSEAEDVFHERFTAATRMRPMINIRVPAPGGRAIELDVWFPRQRLNVEIDGRQHLLDHHQQSDRERDARLAAIGIRVLRVSARAVLGDWPRVLLQVLDALGR